MKVFGYYTVMNNLTPPHGSSVFEFYFPPDPGPCSLLSIHIMQTDSNRGDQPPKHFMTERGVLRDCTQAPRNCCHSERFVETPIANIGRPLTLTTYFIGPNRQKCRSLTIPRRLLQGSCNSPPLTSLTEYRLTRHHHTRRSHRIHQSRKPSLSGLSIVAHSGCCPDQLWPSYPVIFKLFWPLSLY